MQRLRLIRSVSITGRDVRGRKSTLIISPLSDETDRRWLWRAGGEDVEIKPHIMKVGGFLGRCVVLVHTVRGKKYRFHEFEHIAFLHAFGLRGVRIWLEDSTWPPFMCQLELRRQTRPLLIQQGLLRLYHPDYTYVRAKEGIDRHVRYTSDRLNSLVLAARVDYGGGWEGSHLLDFWSGMGEGALERVLNARTFGKPLALKPIAWAASHLPQWRKQSKKIVWGPWWGALPLKICDELARHKVHDGSLVSFAAPPECFLGGTVEFFRSGHELDLEMTQELYPNNTVMAFRKAI
jgi:hypothetical protein